MQRDSIGIAKTEYYKQERSLRLESGKVLPSLTVAYETYGELNSSKSNAVLVLHALSGDAHAAGFHKKTDKKPGWWDNMIGPGKAFDTDKLFVISTNILGGCKGTTGPSSVNPETGKPYAMDFPVITIDDMVKVQKILTDYLGIKRLLSVAGGSAGGMQALQWIVSYPDAIKSAVIIAASLTQSAQNIALHEAGRQAIISDPLWNDGNYYHKKKRPVHGLAVARMIGHISYLSDSTMHKKFGRSLLNNGNNYAYDFSAEFEVQSYLRHQGASFVKRFDANSYLYITKAIDYFNLKNEETIKAFKRAKTDLLAISFSTDWLYPAPRVREIVRAARAGGAKATYFEVESSNGHDGFLLDAEKQDEAIKNFLENQTVK